MSDARAEGTVHQVSVSRGGVPKLAVLEGRVTATGIEGDRQAKPGIHGGPYRALCLYPLEEVERLAAEGHPIYPGSIGENVTTRGLDWSRVVPGARLRLGGDVVIEVTGYTDPCRTIAGSFADGNMNRVNQRVAPGSSRVYARVLSEGTVRPGDPIAVEPPGEADAAPLLAASGIRDVAQVALPVADLERSVAFYRDALGAVHRQTIEAYDLAFLEAGVVRLMLEGPRHRLDGAGGGAMTVYFAVEEIDSAYEAMAARGVAFDAPPLLQYERDGLQGWMAFFRDPDNNRLALVSEVTIEATT